MAVSHSFARRVLPWALVFPFFLAVIVAIFAHSHGNSSELPLVRSYVVPPEETSFVFNRVAGGPVLSPDGTQLVFMAKDSSGKELLWRRPLDTALAAQPLKGTEGASVPFWSPDSRSIGFFVPGKLVRIGLAGGDPQVICDAPSGRGGTWNSQGLIVFAGSAFGGLDQVPATGGTPVPISSLVTTGGQLSQRWPVFLPDGRHFLYFQENRASPNGETAGIYVGSLDGQTPKFLLHSESDALYAWPGYLLFLRNQTLMAQRFDLDALNMTGDAFPVGKQVANPQAWSLGHFSVSQTGLLAYEKGDGPYQVAWIDEKGERTGTMATAKTPWHIRLSPDGKALAESIEDPKERNTDIWLFNVATYMPTRFTFNPAIDNVAVWSPDGSQIVFDSHRTGQGDLYIKDAKGAGDDKLLLASEGLKFPTDWSRDGRFIAYEELDTKRATGWNIWILPRSGKRNAFAFLDTQFNERNAVFSPDGRWLAYQSDQSGKPEIYLTSFPVARGGKQVSLDGGAMPKWRRDGKAIYYISPRATLMEAVVAENNSAIEVASARELFQSRLPEDYASGMDLYDVAPDGRRFLFMERQDTAPEPVTLVANWTASIPK